jgi:di/tricarboxylate transporter
MSMSHAQLPEVYGLHERWVKARVPDRSPLLDRTLAEIGLGEKLGVNVIAILRHGKSRLAPAPNEPLRAEDVIYLQAREEQIEALRSRGLEVRPEAITFEQLTSDTMALWEVVLSPRSQAAGKTLRALHFREKFDLSVIAIWRKGRPRRVGLADMPLQLGDALLVLGARQRMNVLHSEGDFIVLTETVDDTLRTNKMPFAIAIMAATILVAALGWLATAEAMLAGALAMVLIGALSMDEAYQAIEWKSIFLIAAMLPVGLALTKTGVALQIGSVLVGGLGPIGPVAIVTGLVVMTMLLTQVMSGPAAVAILAPIAIQTAQAAMIDPRWFALAVAYGGSLAFMAPLGHPVNILVMGPGGYKFSDFVRVGAPLTLVLIAVIVALIALGLRG